MSYAKETEENESTDAIRHYPEKDSGGLYAEDVGVLRVLWSPSGWIQ